MTASSYLIPVETESGTISIPSDLRDACVRQALVQAEMVALILKNIGIIFSDKVRLPAAYMLELGAVAQISLWEQQGIIEHLNNSELPSYAEAAKQLCERAKKGRDEFKNLDSAYLSQLVVSVWLKQSAWNAQQIIGADVIFSPKDEESLDMAIAKYIWENRHLLSELIEQERGEK